MHDVFGVKRSPGLSEPANVQLESVLRPQVVVSDPIPGGTIPRTPAELLLSLSTGDWLQRLQDQYDLVLIDTPPVLAVSMPACWPNGPNGAPGRARRNNHVGRTAGNRQASGAGRRLCAGRGLQWPGLQAALRLRLWLPLPAPRLRHAAQRHQGRTHRSQEALSPCRASPRSRACASSGCVRAWAVVVR